MGEIEYHQQIRGWGMKHQNENRPETLCRIGASVVVAVVVVIVIIIVIIIFILPAILFKFHLIPKRRVNESVSSFEP